MSELGMDVFESFFRYLWLCIKIFIISSIIAFFMTKDLRNENYYLNKELKKSNNINEILVNKLNEKIS